MRSAQRHFIVLGAALAAALAITNVPTMGQAGAESDGQPTGSLDARRSVFDPPPGEDVRDLQSRRPRQ